MKIGDRVFVRGYVDEIRKDTVIVRNDGGYFGTIPSEVITGELPSAQPDSKELSSTHKALDTISRQAAIEALSKLMVPYGDGSYPGDNEKMAYDESLVDAIQEIKNLPPVQPTQPNCEYCHTDRDGYVFPLEKNSHAFIDRDKIVLKANGWRGEAKIKYCPICGRRLTDG